MGRLNTSALDYNAYEEFDESRESGPVAERLLGKGGGDIV